VQRHLPPFCRGSTAEGAGEVTVTHALRANASVKVNGMGVEKELGKDEANRLKKSQKYVSSSSPYASTLGRTRQPSQKVNVPVPLCCNNACHMRRRIHVNVPVPLCCTVTIY